MDDDKGWYNPFLFTPFKSSIPGVSCHLPKEAAAFEGEAIVVPAIPDVSHGIHGQITSGILWQCPIHSCGWAVAKSESPVDISVVYIIYIVINMFQPSKIAGAGFRNGPSTVGKVGWMVLNITGSLQMISPMVGHFPSPRPFSKPQRCVGSVLKQDDYVTEDERARIRNSSVLASLRAP